MSGSVEWKHLQFVVKPLVTVSTGLDGAEVQSDVKGGNEEVPRPHACPICFCKDPSAPWRKAFRCDHVRTCCVLVSVHLTCVCCFRSTRRRLGVPYGLYAEVGSTVPKEWRITVVPYVPSGSESLIQSSSTARPWHLSKFCDSLVT